VCLPFSSGEPVERRALARIGGELFFGDHALGAVEHSLAEFGRSSNNPCKSLNGDVNLFCKFVIVWRALPQLRPFGRNGRRA